MILSSTYLGNVQWFGKLLSGDAIIDLGEHYVKQSWRSRCEILTAQGRAGLSVHVAAGSQRLAMRDVRLDHSKRWSRAHLQALRSAYGRAPFFEHYWGDFEGVLRREYAFLWELNHELLTVALTLLKADVTPCYSTEYLHGADDFRNTISPKARLHRPDAAFRAVPYWQVFCEGGFEPNLSIVDVLMCEGPAAAEIVNTPCENA